MKRVYAILQVSLLSLFVVTLVSSCGVKSTTKEALWPKMYTETPLSIMVMPPINQTQHVAAKEYFYSSIAAPLIDRGYYVFSPYLTLDLLEQESAGDAEPFLEGSLKVFRSVLNTDAVLFTVIKRWDKSVVGNTIRVEVEYILRSAKTDETLFRRTADVSVDTRISSGGGLFDMIANAIATAATSKIVGARKANYFLLQDIPDGKYAPLYGKDKGVAVSSEHIKGTTVK